MAYRLGVDLGTTFTAAAVSNGMPPTMVGLGNRALQIPSVLFLTDAGEFLVGESAERRGLADPDRVVREFKRRIGDSVPMLVAGSPYSPQSLTAKLLRHVVGTATERMGSPPSQIVLTHPANWGPYKLELLDQVAALADAPPASRCPEPLAAALQYASQTRVEVDDVVAVYDLGGGTFDACVLRKTPAGFDLLGSPEGIEHLGGIDFDEALFRHAISLLGDRISHLDPDDPGTTHGLARLRRDCVDAKEALSSDTDTLLPVSLPGLSTTLRLTRSEFESLIRPSLADTVTALERTLRSAGVTPDQLSVIVLVGGSSRIPLVGELLQHRFSTPTALDTHPKHDVVLGAVQSVGAPSAGGFPPPSAISTLRGPAVPPRTSPGPAPISTDPASAQPTTPRSAPAASSDPALPPAPVTGRADGVPAGAPPGPPGVPPEPSPSGRRRRLTLVAVAAAAVTAGVVTGLVVVANRTDEVTAGGPSFNPSVPGPSPTGSVGTPTIEPGQLPRSEPLAPTQLVVPMLTGDNWDLWLGDTTQPAPVLRLTTDSAPDTTPAISPDARTVIYTHDLDTDGKRTLLVKGATTGDDGRPLFDPLPEQCQGTMFRPAWNPVATDELAVPCVDAGGAYGLYRFRTDGTLIAPVELPAGAGRIDDPAYSADGKTLVFWAAPPSTWDGGTLYTVPASGGRPKVLVKTTRAGEDADPVWSPDGDHVTFRRRMSDNTTGGNFDIFRVTTDGAARLDQLTDDPADEQDPSYSPDGRQIAYKSAARNPDQPDNAIARTWIMDADGGSKRLLWTEGPDNPQTAPGWGRR